MISKVCTGYGIKVCGVELVPGENWSEGNHRHGVYHCKSCVVEWSAIRNKAQKEKYGTTMTRGAMLTQYGCTPEEYRNSMATSDVCECCGSEDSLVYDHCHSSTNFRGVLCASCNKGIGQLGDTQESVERALNYFKTRG